MKSKPGSQKKITVCMQPSALSMSLWHWILNAFFLYKSFHIQTNTQMRLNSLIIFNEPRSC